MGGGDTLAGQPHVKHQPVRYPAVYTSTASTCGTPYLHCVPVGDTLQPGEQVERDDEENGRKNYPVRQDSVIIGKGQVHFLLSFSWYPVCCA
jgi:hypothetical protein